MATGPAVTERCLLCGRELPRGGFSARVAGILLSPLCAECERQCASDPNRVMAEHPQWFDGSEIIDPHIHPTSSTLPPRPPINGEQPRVVTQPAPYSNVSGSPRQQVIVTDIHMPFGSMVAFMVKWSIASIPAFIILFLLGVIALGVLTMITGFGKGLLGR